jgi:hypothetical protein
LIPAEYDDDISTDEDILQTAIELCERDLKETYRHIVGNQRKTERGTSNYQY